MNHTGTLVHVAIIMDGNGRWAKSQNLPRLAGHRAGANVAKEIIKHAAKKKIPFLTLFAFSTENWLRPHQEVKELMRLLEYYIDKELKLAIDEGIKFVVSGRIGDMPLRIRKKILQAIENSAKNEGMTLNLALSYGGREEIVDAAKKIALDASFGRINVDGINENIFERYLYNPKLPDIDLLIRTSGEKRISNFMLWRLAYTELLFTDTLWPDFTTKEFDEDLESYPKRMRRFGLTDEQILNQRNIDE